MTKAVTHGMNRRNKMPEGIEVRFHEDGTVDEIIVSDRDGRCLLHMEQMADSCFWIGLTGYSDPGNPVHVDLFTDGRMVQSDDDDDSEKGCQQIFARIRT